MYVFVSPSSAVAGPVRPMLGLTFATVTVIKSEPVLLVGSLSSAVTITADDAGPSDSWNGSGRDGHRLVYTPCVGRRNE